MSLRYKIVIFIFVAIIVPFSGIMYFLLQSLDKSSAEAERKALEDTSALVRQELVNNVNAKAQVFDLTFKQMILGLEEVKDLIIDNNIREEYLSRYYYNNQVINTVYYINLDDESMFFPNPGDIDVNKYRSSKLKKFELLFKEKTHSGKWTGPYKDLVNQDNIYTYAIPLYDEGLLVGVIGFDISTKKIFSDITSVDPAKNSYAFIVRADKTFITSSDAFYSDFQIQKDKSALLESNNIQVNNISDLLGASAKKEGSIDLNSEKRGNLIIAYSLIPSFQGKLFSVSPENELLAIQQERAKAIQQAVRQVGVVSVYFVGGFALLLTLASFFLSGRGIIGPINKLKSGIENFEKTGLNTSISVSSKDEIGILASSFNQMMANLQKSILQIKREGAKLQTSIGSLPLGFIMTDTNYNILLANASAKKVLCSQENDHTCTFEELCKVLGPSINIKAYVQKSITERKTFLIKEATFGSKFLKIFITAIIEEQLVIGSVILIEDITEEKVLERSKNEFFSIASHELRTPLTAIKGNTSLIKEYYLEGMKDKELKDMIEDIHQSSVRLIEIVNDFLDMSRLETGKIEFKKIAFDVSELVKNVIEELKINASQKSINLEYLAKDTKILDVFADLDKTKQVLINLIGNAIKFTEKGGVSISIEQIPQKTNSGIGFLKILIADTGRGISQENQNLLFRKFQQAGDSLLTRDTTKGTGLGLYISKLIIEGMGGTIGLESTVEGKGTVFGFTLPIATEEQKKQIKSESTVKTDISTGLTEEKPSVSKS